jgi:hypothetical protein
MTYLTVSLYNLIFEKREERKGSRERRRARIPAVKSKQCSAEELVGCSSGCRIELRVGVDPP